MNKVVIHQAFYGEVNRAHSKINQTIDDSELTSFLIKFTDRPGSLQPGIVLKPYISGSAFKNYYIFSKTFSDTKASRSGMVLTHVLITELTSLEYLNNIKEVLNLLISEVPSERTNLKSIELTPKYFDFVYEKRQPTYIQKSLSILIKGDLPIRFTGTLVSFEKILQKLWHLPINGFRKKIKYRASFSPQDLEQSDDLTLVYIQNELLSRWNSNDLINEKGNEIIEITSLTETLFLGGQKDNPLFDFLKDIGANLHDLATYKQGDMLYASYRDLDKANDPNYLRQNIRLLAKLSPNKSRGGVVKKAFIKKLLELINNGLETNVRGLRNISWNSFDQGEKNGKSLINAIIKKTIRNSQFKQIEMLSDITIIAVNELNKTWWHKAVIESLKSNLSNSERVIQHSIWNLLLVSKDCSKAVFSIIPSHEDSELLLIQYIPDKVPNEIGRALLSELQKREWYLLHAEILLKLYKPKQAVEKQLALEDSLGFEKSIGVNLILDKLQDVTLLNIVLELCDYKLIKKLVKRIINNESLLKSINLDVPCWLNIWTNLLHNNQPFNYGIKGREQVIVFNVFDLALQNKKVDKIVFEKIAKTPHSDLSNYKKRHKVWKYIPVDYQDDFIKKTANSIIDKLVSEEVDQSSIEQTLVDYIISTPFIELFLNQHKDNIRSVLKFFEHFSTLPDEFLSDYIRHYQLQITEYDSKYLGNLVLNLHFKSSAKEIYFKSLHNKSFKIAYEICKPLVWLKLWEYPLLGMKNLQLSRNNQMEQSKERELELLPKVVILTAIKEEYLAVREHLTKINEETKKSTTYEVGLFSVNEKSVAHVVIRECGPKNTNASLETERAIQYFSPDLILFVGIAGSRKPKDFNIGDVIFPTMIYSYEGGKSEKESFSSRPDMGGTTYHLNEIAKRERLKDDWKKLIKNAQHKDVKADLGIIASGEKLVEHYESGIGKILSIHFNDTSAIEMEGFGFAKAASKQGQEYANMMVGVVRGISDIIGQPNVNEIGNNDRRPINTKQIASDTAAAFTFWLIYKVFF